MADLDVVMLPLCSSKLDPLDLDEVETQPGSGLSMLSMETDPESCPFAEGESFEGFDDDAFNNFGEDTFNNFDFFNSSPALASSGGFDLESLQQLKEVRAIGAESADECDGLISAEAADAMLDAEPLDSDWVVGGPERAVRPSGCPVDPCLLVSLNKLTIRTQRWASLPPIPEHEPIFVPPTGTRVPARGPWWKRCFGSDDEGDGSDVSSDVAETKPCGFRRTVSTRDVRA
jgi:hypothetical protein